MSTFHIEPTGSTSTDCCQCCGSASHCVWGFVHSGNVPISAYFVHWTEGHVVDHPANIDLIIGDWSDDGLPASRSFVALEYHHKSGATHLTVIDGGSRPAADKSVVANILHRSELVGTDLESRAKEIVQAVLANDRRLAELNNPSQTNFLQPHRWWKFW